MYSCQIKKYILSWVLVTLWLCGYVFWIDLIEEIYTDFKPDYDNWLSDEYLTIPYDPWYSKDPYWDAMRVHEWMSVQAKIAWVKYVERALAVNGCSLSKKKQWAILYYFLPEFRMGIARQMKMEIGDSSSKNYTFDDEEILKYCTEFYNCITYKSAWESEASTKVITSGTPEDIKTNCKEFFQTNYREWQAEEKKVQDLQIVRLWTDKYVNSTTEDSPYDTVVDLGTIGELSYDQAQKPVTPVFYDLPVFTKSKEALLKAQDRSSKLVKEEYRGEVSLSDVWWTTSLSPAQTNVRLTNVQTNAQTNSSIKPLSRPKWLTLEEYDKVVEWLWAYKLNNDESANYWSLCEEVEEEAEPEEKAGIVPTAGRSVTTLREVPESVKVEYQELVDYMLDAVNSYTSLSEEKMKEIEKKAWNVARYNGAVTEEQIENTAKNILGCYKSCVWLRIDEQFTCMLKCSCGEIKSPIFNPDVNPGLWPIFMIRFCTVPSVNPRYFYEWSSETDMWDSTMNKIKTSLWIGNKSAWWKKWWSSEEWTAWESDDWDSLSNAGILTSFHKGWITIVSMEKWIAEALWVVDKLSREWRLGVWTQQHNFLDSTTKLTDVADTFSFTISASQKKITRQPWESSEEYKQRNLKMKNDNLMEVTHVSNSIDNPATRNYYRLVGYQWEIVWDISSSANADATRQAQWYLNVAPWFMVNQGESSNAARYATVSELFSNWMDEQWDFWAQKVEYLKELDDYAKALYAKKW